MSKLSFGNYILNTQKSRLYHQGNPLELEPQIFGILELLITRHGEIVSRDEMIDAVWDGRRVSNNVLDSRIKSVRAAIGDSGKAQRYIKTYPNLGYKFIGEVSFVNEAQHAVETITPAHSPKSQNVPTKHPSHEGFIFGQNPKFLTFVGVAVAGLLGVFVFFQSMSSGITQTPSLEEVKGDTAVYKLATSDDPNALPRVAVLPFEIIGEPVEYGVLPEVFKSEINHTITAIDGITVVAISSGAKIEDGYNDFNLLREAFGLDYAIASRLTSYGKNYKLSVSLLSIEDRSDLYSESYELNISRDDGLKDLPGVIARKVTLMTANKLNLSADRLPKSWENYDFYKKLKMATATSKSERYEDIKKSTDILREVIREEPLYIPAYSDLISTISWQLLFWIDGDDYLVDEQNKLVRKMTEIAPDAPETLIMNAFMGSVEGGVHKMSNGEYVKNDPVSVINK